MGLQFYSQVDTFCEPDDFLEYWRLEPESAQFIDSFEMGEFDKLMPWVELCNRRGIKICDYFEDTVLKNYQFVAPLEILRACYGEIAQRRPFYHHSETHKDPFVRMLSLLETTLKSGRGIMTICD